MAEPVVTGRPPTLEEYREEVARLRKGGLSGRAVAKKLGIPSSSVFKLISQIE
jgi:DNA invertase Pin-like site-specific DNA recombinase